MDHRLDSSVQSHGVLQYVWNQRDVSIMGSFRRCCFCLFTLCSDFDGDEHVLSTFGLDSPGINKTYSEMRDFIFAAPKPDADL